MILYLGTFAGSTKALKAYISGDGFGIPSILDEPLVLRRFQRTFSSLYFIFPDTRFWPSDMVSLVKTIWFVSIGFENTFKTWPISVNVRHHISEPLTNFNQVYNRLLIIFLFNSFYSNLSVLLLVFSLIYAYWRLFFCWKIIIIHVNISCS